MRKCLIVIFSLALLLTACGKKQVAPTWQEQYDLGVRYLSEGNYEEAIIAFTAAIEIDPKRIEAYSSLANTYVIMGEHEKATGVWDLVPNDISDAHITTVSLWQEKRDEIRLAQESGETGIWILNCNFNSDTFLTKEETTFEIVAYYQCPENSKYRATISANIEDPFARRNIGDEIVIDRSSGVLSLSGSTLPPNWEGIYFALNVDIWDSSDYGNWICGDEIYLTQEGTLSDTYAPVNSYGSTEFTCRADYRDFSSLDYSLQNRIENIARAVIAGDKDQVLSLVSEGGCDISIYTIWNDYKIEIWDCSDWRTNDGSKTKSYDIEMRPNDGIGFYAAVYRSQVVDTANKDYWNDDYYTVEIASCPCVDWQWNGAVEVRYYMESFWHDVDDVTCHTVETTTVNGTMLDGLWDGIATATTHRTDDWNIWEDTDDTYVTTRVFQNGIQIEQDGEPWDGGKGYRFISDYDGGGISYGGIHGGQNLLDHRYW